MRTNPTGPARLAAAVLTALTALSIATACHARGSVAPVAHPDRAADDAQASYAYRPPPEIEAPIAPLLDRLPKRPCTDDPRIDACAVHRPDATPHLLGMAARGDTIGVAWVTSGNAWLADPSPGTAHFAWFDASLRRRGEVRLELPDAGYDIDLAAAPDGWIVAVQAGTSTELMRLADDGTIGARTRLDKAWAPGLAVAPGGDVLVAHMTERGGQYPIQATLVDRSGAVVWSSEVFDGVVEPNFGGQVYTDGGGFLVGRRANPGVSVARVEADGRVTARRLVGGSTEYPALAWCGRAGRLVWTDFGALKIRSAAIDLRGDVLGAEQILGGTPEYFNHSPTLCDGAYDLVLLGGYTGGTGVSNRLDLARVDPRHGVLPGALAVLDPAEQSAYDPRLARLADGRVAVAWISLGKGGQKAQLALAVVDPARAPARRGPLVVDPR